MWVQDEKGNFYWKVGAFNIKIIRPYYEDGRTVSIKDEGKWWWTIELNGISSSLRQAKTWHQCILDARSYLMETLLTALGETAKMYGVGDQITRIEGGNSADQR